MEADGQERKYTCNAFISYSHTADGKLAPALQSALHKLAKPWYRLRAIRVFRNKTNLAASPSLWPSIEKALSESEYFLLMASPTAAESRWVKREIRWWLEHQPIEKMLILLTEGELLWNEAKHDFDWEKTTALPQDLRETPEEESYLLKGKFKDEPHYVDLCSLKIEGDFNLRDAQFHDAALNVAAPLHGKPKDELAGEDISQYKKTRRIAWAAGWLLFLLFLTASAAAYIALRQRQEAERQRDAANHARIRAEQQANIATSRQLAAQSLGRSVRLDLGLLLSLEANGIVNTVESRGSLLEDLLRSPHLTTFLTGHTKDVRSVAFSSDGKTLASGSGANTVILWDVASRQPLGPPLTGHTDSVRSVAFSSDGKTLASGSDDKTIILWDVSLESWQARACRIANRNLTRAEWEQYIGDIEPYRATCPELPIEAEALKH